MADVYGLSEEANRQLREMFRAFYATHVYPLLGRKRWFNAGGGGCISRICRPRKDVDTGDVMVCDIQEGPIFAETDTGETLIGINTGSPIAADTRCEAVHYSCRKGGEPHLLTGDEVSSFLSSAALSDGVSSTTADQYAEYELFSLEC